MGGIHGWNMAPKHKLKDGNGLLPVGGPNEVRMRMCEWECVEQPSSKMKTNGV